MKYFIDTEFIEGPQKTWWGGKTKPTIDLISIGIVASDGREYYAISKDFYLKEAWNRYDEKVNMNYKPSVGGGQDGPYNPMYTREYWLRENVLRPIFDDLAYEDYPNSPVTKFTYRSLNYLIKKYGKSNDQIAKEIIEFVRQGSKSSWMNKHHDSGGCTDENIIEKEPPQFYAHYADYDWVAFCWLFGRMIDLPKGFPMYCRDLKQMMDEKIEKSWDDVKDSTFGHVGIENIKNNPNYPKQTNEHNALADARWNFELYKFIQGL